MAKLDKFIYNATLVRIVDGDTCDAMIDLGFDTWIKKRIRLYGINAPEIRTKNLEEKKAGIAAKDRLSEIMEQCDYKFILISHGTGKYGRCLGTLLIEDVNINKLLLSEGFAKEYV